jgi:predicted porin
MVMRILSRALFGAMVVSFAPSALACSACGCTLSSDWASQGLATSNGWRFDARFDFFDQDQLREGTDSVSRSSVEIPNEREVQQFTINRNYTLAADYSPNKDWGISVALPWFDRSHATIAEGDTQISTSHDQGIGDLRVMARYSGFDEQRTSGIEFGLKLPTGHFTDTFASGPQQGEIVDRGLQLGTGTTDVLFGVYNFGAISQDWGYFAQALLQQPLNSRDDFKPGTGVNLNFGVRYNASDKFVPQLQINARVEKREQGANADIENSGATLVYLSPGATFNFSRRFSAYAFVQAPLYQRVNGLQIEARWLGSVGLHYIF